MDGYHRKGFEFDTFTITKREIVASVSIIAVLLLIGALISSKISDYQMDKNERYNKAAKLESSDLFDYGMRTNIGNAFVYGKLETVDPVTYPEIGGAYMYVEKVKEKYTMHTRTVTTRDSKGHTHTRTETYWSWDYAGSEDRTCKEIRFLGIVFPSKKIELPDANYIETIKESRRIRYKYYGIQVEHTGTIFTELKNRTISDRSSFYKDWNIEETVDHLESLNLVVFFWIIWVLLIGGCMFGFYYLDNNWLE